MTSKKKEPDDSAIIEFEAGCDDERKLFVLKITSTQGLTDDEYSSCLKSFSADIDSGTFSFDDMKEKVGSDLN